MLIVLIAFCILGSQVDHPVLGAKILSYIFLTFREIDAEFHRGKVFIGSAECGLSVGDRHHLSK